MHYWTILALVVSGCATSSNPNYFNEIQRESRKNREALLMLGIGMSKHDVKSIMDLPRFNEAYEISGKSMEFWFYFTDEIHFSVGRIDRERCTPILFENGKVKGWGPDYIKKYDLTIKKDLNIEID